MSYQNNFLFRETLADTGQRPTTGYIYSSPDIICHTQVATPQEFFSGNYNADPNERVNMGTVNNFMYTRVKNLGTTTEPITGYVNVYRSNSSLFMQPSQWSKTPLRTVNNNVYSEVTSNTQGEIVVGSDIFLLSGLNNNYFCMMGIVSDAKEPTYPQENFRTYDDFVYWLRTNQAVCARNLSLEYNCQRLDYERLDEFSNPEATEVQIFFLITARNLDNGAKFGMICEPLRLNEEVVFDASSPTNMFALVAMVPSKFDGYVKTYGILPGGKTIWPANAEIEIETYTPLAPSAKSYRFAADSLKLNIPRKQLSMLDEPKKLVKIGSCRSVFNIT